MRRLTGTEIKELHSLRRTILTGMESAEVLVKAARGQANAAVAEALLVGVAVRRLKELAGADGLAQLDSKRVPDEVITRYVRLANRAHGSDLLGTGSWLAWAYATLGIVGE